MGSDGARVALLRAVANSSENAESAAARDQLDEAAIIDALEALEQLSPGVATALAKLLDNETPVPIRIELLNALTDDVVGRYAAAEVLGDRAEDRLGDARAAVNEFENMLTSANETDLQGFLEANPWILGLDYAQMRARHPIVRGTVDFILERFDGFHDLLELKSPQDGIVLAPDQRRGVRAPANRYRLSPALAQALAQVHVYRDALRDEAVTEKHFGLPHAYDPRILILIGTASQLSSERLRVLRELNRSLHRVEVLPYDWVGDRATAILDNAERYLVTAEQSIED